MKLRTQAILIIAATLSSATFGQDKAAVQARLDSETKELSVLKARSSEITKEIGALASSVKIPQDQEAAATLKRLADELVVISQRLAKMDEEIADLRAFMTGAKKTLPEIEHDVKSLKATKVSAYTQFQYQGSDAKGSTLPGGNGSYAFYVRRTRFGVSHQPDPRTTFKLELEVAEGTNRNTTDLHDAYVNYRVSEHGGLATDLRVGQQNMTLGYDIDRSSSQREMPERALYTRSLFNGESNRGIRLTQGLAKYVNGTVGLFNSLTTRDPEQLNSNPGPGSALSAVGGLRYQRGGVNLGLTGLVGNRAAYTVTGANGFTAPSIHRQYVYADAVLDGVLHPQLVLRAEAMAGKDRVPGTNSEAVDMTAWQVQGGWRFDGKTQIHLRYEQWDPNKATGGNLQSGIGAVLLYDMSANIRLSAAYERFRIESRTPGTESGGVTTLRLQYRF